MCVCVSVHVCMSVCMCTSECVRVRVYVCACLKFHVMVLPNIEQLSNMIDLPLNLLLGNTP